MGHPVLVTLKSITTCFSELFSKTFMLSSSEQCFPPKFCFNRILDFFKEILYGAVAISGRSVGSQCLRFLAVGTLTKTQEKSSWYRIKFSIQMSVLNTDVGAWYCLVANYVFFRLFNYAGLLGLLFFHLFP